jgi:transcriptional regulator with XRE-family HTH domain
LKQEDIAKKAGIAVGTVQHIEYNKHKVTVEKIEKYAAALGTTAEQLRHPETATMVSEPARGSLVERNLGAVHDYLTLRPEHRKLVDDLVRALKLSPSISPDSMSEWRNWVAAMEVYLDDHPAHTPIVIANLKTRGTR